MCIPFRLKPVFLPKNCRAHQTEETRGRNQSDEKVAEALDLCIQLFLFQNQRWELNYITTRWQSEVIMEANQTCADHIAGAFNMLQLSVELGQAHFTVPLSIGIGLANSLTVSIDFRVNCECNVNTSTQFTEVGNFFTH